MAYPNSFAAALAEHDGPRLRAAFDATKAATGERYDRTTLNRWTSGSIPTKGDFIRRLADELDDPAIYSSWVEVRDSQTPSQARSVVSRFESLTPEEKDWAFHQIRRDYLAEYPAGRSRLTYRIEIDEPAEPSDDHLQVTVDEGWMGDVQADAAIQYVTEYQDLSVAYHDPSCLFREELRFEPDRLQELLVAGDDQILAITPLGTGNPLPARHVGRLDESGRFAFGNERAINAQVQLNMSYPYPRGRPVFFLRWGRYQVPDTVEVTLVLRSRSLSEPRAFPFMPPGRQQEFTSTLIRPNELKISLGTGNTVLGEGDGVVLYWTDGS